MPGTGIDRITDKERQEIIPEILRDAFNPLPSQRMQEKMDFFYAPYN